MKIIKNIMLILIFTILILGGKSTVYADIAEEDISIIKNPDRGFYKKIEIELQQKDEDFEKFQEKIDEIRENDKDISLILLKLNLKNFIQTSEITNKKVEDINKYFLTIRENGYKVIFKVIYGSEENPEPEINTILKQIEQLKDVYKSNKDIILVVEAGFLGADGEWINGRYDGYTSEKNKVIDKMLEIIPQEIQINFRKPVFITDYIGSQNTVNVKNAYTSERIARIGLYNSGYLSSETDEDTYQRIERIENLKWQNLQTQYTIFGGTVKNWKSTYNDLENAISDMFSRHCTYLDKDEDEDVKKKWKGTIYTGSEELYNRKNGYIYIQNHLGYRLLLTNVEMSGTEAGKKANVSINLENIGFGNIIKEKQVSLIYKNLKNTYKIETNIDIRKKLQNQNYILEIDEKLPEDMEDGEYNVYLSIGEPYETLKDDSRYYIKLANKNLWNEETKGNYLGKVTIDSNTNKDGDNLSNIISQTTNNQESTVNSKIVIGVVVGILGIIFLIIIIIIKNKKHTDLSIK